MRSQNHTVWKLDTQSAAYPWELLQDLATQAKPLCVSAGMIRQLATSDYRTQVNRSYKNNALIIGDPNLDGFASQLPGAVEEAEAVAAVIGEQGYNITQQINADFKLSITAVAPFSFIFSAHLILTVCTRLADSRDIQITVTTCSHFRLHK